MNNVSKAAAVLGKLGGMAGTGDAKARTPEQARKAAYARWKTRTLAERFWEKVDKRGPDECWPWTGGKNENGYGVLWMENRLQKATRASWVIHNGDFDRSLCALHKCDNPPCVNPSHLFLGTLRDNVDDAMRKHRVRIGEKHGRAKLKESQVVEIRKRYTNATRHELAKEFNISDTHLKKIARRGTWKHIK